MTLLFLLIGMIFLIMHLFQQRKDAISPSLEESINGKEKFIDQQPVQVSNHATKESQGFSGKRVYPSLDQIIDGMTETDVAFRLTQQEIDTIVQDHARDPLFLTIASYLSQDLQKRAAYLAQAKKVEHPIPMTFILDFINHPRGEKPNAAALKDMLDDISTLKAIDRDNNFTALLESYLQLLQSKSKQEVHSLLKKGMELSQHNNH